jgi:hypothetical protein
MDSRGCVVISWCDEDTRAAFQFPRVWTRTNEPIARACLRRCGFRTIRTVWTVSAGVRNLPFSHVYSYRILAATISGVILSSLDLPEVVTAFTTEAQRVRASV